MIEVVSNITVPKHELPQFLCDKFKKSFQYYKQGDLVVIGAKPFHGKSSFLYDLLVKALEKKKKSLLIDFSTNRSFSLSKVAARYAQINHTDLLKATLTESSLEAYNNAQQEIRKSKSLFIPQKIDFAVIDQLESYFTKCCNKEKIEYLFVDFLQIFGMNPLYGRYAEVSAIVLKLKQLAIKHGLIVFATSTFNRKFEEREDKTPKVTDLRDSGAIEDSADYILLLDGYSNEESVRKEVHIYSNHSNSPTKVTYNFFPKAGIFI